MNIKTYKPGAPLSQFIDTIQSVSIDLKTLISNQTLYVPNGYPSLIIHLKNSISLCANNSMTVLPEMFFVGLRGSSAQLHPIGDLESIFILFRPNALHQLFKIDMKEVNRRLYVDAFDVLGYGADKLYSMLLELKNWDDKVHCLFSFFNSVVYKKHYNHDFVNMIIREIEKAKGCCRVIELANEFNVRERSLHHKFFLEMGIAPKEFARIIRFRHLFQYFKNVPVENWFDMINSGALHDQSHLIKEIKHFTGYTPTRLQELNVDLLHILNGTT